MPTRISNIFPGGDGIPHNGGEKGWLEVFELKFEGWVNKMGEVTLEGPN